MDVQNVCILPSSSVNTVSHLCVNTVPLLSVSTASRLSVNNVFTSLRLKKKNTTFVAKTCKCFINDREELVVIFNIIVYFYQRNSKVRLTYSYTFTRNIQNTC